MARQWPKRFRMSGLLPADATLTVRDGPNVSGAQLGLIGDADVVVATANQTDRPTYVEIARKAMAQRGGSRPYFGSIPDFGSEEAGYALSGVAAGSPAEKGGLKGGDRIVELGGEKIGDLIDFDLALRKFSAGDDSDVVVMRNGQRVKLKVTLAKPR